MILQGSECPFCHAQDAQLLWEKESLRNGQGARDIYRCRVCATIYPHPREVPDDFDWPVPASDYLDPFHPVSRRSVFFRAFSKYIGNKGAVAALDIGAATGQLCAFFKSTGLQEHGLELDRHQVGFACSKGLNLMVGSFPEAVPDAILQKKFNLITCMETIYYFRDLKKALSLIADLLSRDGYLFCQVHLPTSYYYWRGMSRFSRYGNCVQTIPELPTLKGQLEKAGLDVCAMIPMPFFWGALVGRAESKGIFRHFDRLLQKVFRLCLLLLGQSFVLRFCDRVFIVARKREQTL